MEDIVKNDNGKLIIENADEATVYLTAGTNYKNYKDVSANPVITLYQCIEKYKG